LPFALFCNALLNLVWLAVVSLVASLVAMAEEFWFSIENEFFGMIATRMHIYYAIESFL